MSRRWYLVPHGATEWNAGSRVQGQWDSSLTPRGREQARTTGRVLANLGVDVLFASPLGRVRETLALIAEHVSVAPVFDDRLKEWSAGAWSGELYADLPARWPEDWAAWVADRYHRRAPGGENFADLAVRARSFLDVATATPAERVAIVAHGFLNRALAEVLLGLTPDESIQINQRNDTVIRIRAAVADHLVGDSAPVPGLPIKAR